MQTVRIKKDYKNKYKKGEVMEMPERRAFLLRDLNVLEIIEPEKKKAMRASLPTIPKYVTK